MSLDLAEIEYYANESDFTARSPEQGSPAAHRASAAHVKPLLAEVRRLMARVEELEAEAAEWQKVASDRAEQVRTVTRRLLVARGAIGAPAPAKLPAATVTVLPECCGHLNGTTHACPVCGGLWADGEPYRRCTYTCTHGERCDIAEPRAWHEHLHGHDGDNNGHTWTTKAAEENPHARCAHAEQHHAHRWGQPAHWCDGTPSSVPTEPSTVPTTTPAVPEKEPTS